MQYVVRNIELKCGQKSIINAHKLRAGDFNGDNNITVLSDKNYFFTLINSSSKSYIEEFDFNKDNEMDELDYQIIYNNVTTLGENEDVLWDNTKEDM